MLVVMSRFDDDHATPIEHRHDAEGKRFRHWREKHPHGTWTSYQREKKARGSLSDLRPREPLPPEAEQRLFHVEHDTGDLDAGEREMLAIGVAPALTPKRFAQRFGGAVGILLVMLAMFIAHSGSWLVALPLGVVGVGLFMLTLLRPTPKRRTKKR